MAESRGRRALRWFHILFGAAGLYFAGSYFSLAAGSMEPGRSVLKGAFWLLIAAVMILPEVLRGRSPERGEDRDRPPHSTR